MFDKLLGAVGRGIERAVEDALIDAIRGSSGKGERSCIQTWLRDFKNHPGGVHLVIGKQRSGKTALCYFLAQKTGRSPIYAITAAQEVPVGVEVTDDIDCVPPGSVCVVDDASLFFNSMRTKDDNYQLLRDLLIFSEKRDLCVLFNAHDTSLLNKTAFSQAKSIIFKEPNLMAMDTERPGVRKILQHVQQGFSRINKGQRASYFYLLSSDCRGWGKAPLPSGWSNKISTSCKITDAEFYDVEEEDPEESFEEKQHGRRRREEKKEDGESFEEFKRKHETGYTKDNQDNRSH